MVFQYLHDLSAVKWSPSTAPVSDIPRIASVDGSLVSYFLQPGILGPFVGSGGLTPF